MTTAPIRPSGGQIPLADHGGLVLRAGRLGTVLPHIGWLTLFAEEVDQEVLDTEAQRLAASPYAFGRRVLPARIPGGRARWVATREAPDVGVETFRIERSRLSAWVDGKITTPLDPEHDAGWLMAAAPLAGGGTAVLTVVHHLFGTAPGLLNAAYGDGSEPPSHGTTVVPFTPDSTYTLRDELAGLGERIILGIRGTARVASDGARLALGKAASHATAPSRAGRLDLEVGSLQPEVGALAQPGAPKGFDRTRRDPGPGRAVGLATIDSEVWDKAAAAAGGTANTLLTAITSNLIRRARIHRGGDVDRPVRLQLPMDLGDDAVRFRRDGASGPRNTTVTAALVVEGGEPQYGDLTVLRRWMKAAFVAGAETALPVRGVTDATRLLPEALTIRAAKRAALAFDGCASNPGSVPEGITRLGADHVAEDFAVIGFPIGIDLIAGCVRTEGSIKFSTTADTARLGAGADYRTWVAEELAAWGLPEVVW